MLKKRPIFFFHNSDTYTARFGVHTGHNHTFFWLGKRYYHHFWTKTYREPYIYFFVKRPVDDDIAFCGRGLGNDFNNIYNHHLLHESSPIEIHRFNKIGDKLRYEPVILMTKSAVVPDLIARFLDNNSKTCEVIFPEKHSGVLFDIFDDAGEPRNFSEIKELVALLPEIMKSLPFVNASTKNGQYFYDQWNPMDLRK